MPEITIHCLVMNMRNGGSRDSWIKCYTDPDEGQRAFNRTLDALKADHKSCISQWKAWCGYDESFDHIGVFDENDQPLVNMEFAAGLTQSWAHNHYILELKPVTLAVSDVDAFIAMLQTIKAK